jgi:C4-dicarboxylate-specific signal transduction histidine kinase
MWFWIPELTLLSGLESLLLKEQESERLTVALDAKQKEVKVVALEPGESVPAEARLRDQEKFKPFITTK